MRSGMCKMNWQQLKTANIDIGMRVYRGHTDDAQSHVPNVNKLLKPLLRYKYSYKFGAVLTKKLSCWERTTAHIFF